VYLHYLTATLNIGGRIVTIAALAFLLGGFVASWFNSGKTWNGNKQVVSWEMKTRWLRNFFRFITPPALVFGIPALIVWFS
jgi:hypothetical protein